MTGPKNIIAKKTVNPIEQIICVYSFIQKKDVFYPFLIISIFFTCLGGIQETMDANLGNYLLGFYNLFLNKNSQAISYFKKVDDTSNQYEYYNAMLGLAYNQNHEYALAKKALLKELELNPFHITVLIKLAHNSLCENKYQDVISYINQYDQKNRIALQVTDSKTNKFTLLDITKQEINKNFEINGEGAVHLNRYLYTGIAYYHLNQYDKALENLNTVIDWGSNDDKNVVKALAYRSLIQQKHK